MLLVITIPKADDSYLRMANRLVFAFQSLAVLNSISCKDEWITRTCVVVSFSSSNLTSDVIDDRLLGIYQAIHCSLPSEHVSDIKNYPDLLFRFLNINVSLKSKL